MSDKKRPGNPRELKLNTRIAFKVEKEVKDEFYDLVEKHETVKPSTLVRQLMMDYIKQHREV